MQPLPSMLERKKQIVPLKGQSTNSLPLPAWNGQSKDLCLWLQKKSWPAPLLLSKNLRKSRCPLISLTCLEGMAESEGDGGRGLGTGPLKVMDGLQLDDWKQDPSPLWFLRTLCSTRGAPDHLSVHCSCVCPSFRHPLPHHHRLGHWQTLL